ncbi:MAG: rod shape-determining protein MreD [Alloprevotella sp.]|nr:rod shape-determining protein MreD [Alloprevotella sp.]
MFQTYLTRTAGFALLVVMQVFVFNHVHLFGYATPLPYIYFLLTLPSTTPRWAYVVLGFALGLLVDLFTNTPGMAAGATCLLGLLLPFLLQLFGPADSDDEPFTPSPGSMEWGPFLRYVFVASLVQCGAFFTIESFSFSAWQGLLATVGASTLLTALLLLSIHLISHKQ